MIILDASVLIALLDGRDAFHDRAVDTLRTAASEPFGASVVTVAEVLVGPSRVGEATRAEDALTRLRLTTVGLGAGAAGKLAGLRATTGLKLPDCCVLLAAQQERASALLSFDDRLVTAAQAAGISAEASS